MLLRVLKDNYDLFIEPEKVTSIFGDEDQIAIDFRYSDININHGTDRAARALININKQLFDEILESEKSLGYLDLRGIECRIQTL